MLRQWGLSTWVFIDKVLNKLTWGKKWETISSRMGVCLQNPDCPKVGKGISKFLCGLLNMLDKDHCINSIETAREQYRLLRIEGKVK